jgi:selenocysteine-specific elongation factor
VIIATSGHVDHGKTTLIKALTGKNTDQLPEEQHRGMTIDLGFAWLHDPLAGAIGFVDVPGHARFIRTMLAGIAGVDAALLVIAADEGPMPQTHEHRVLLDLLGVNRAIVVMSAIDRASPAQRSACHAAIHELLADTRLADSPVIEVCAPSGEGINNLLSAIRTLASSITKRSTAGHPRFLIDRRFSVPGAGCVVTGTLLSGQLSLAEQKNSDLHIGTVHALPVRLRAMQIDGQAVTELRAGQRAALNLAGDFNSRHPQRGDWLLAEGLLHGSARMDIQLRLLPDTRIHRGTLQFLTGASAISGHLIWLDESAGLAQVLLDQPVHTLVGDCIIVREPSANHTLGAGRVLDPLGGQRGRSKPAAIQRLKALCTATHALAALTVETEHLIEVDLPAFAKRWNLRADELDATVHDASVIQLGHCGLSTLQLARIDACLLETVRHAHQSQPMLPGIHQQELLRASAPGLSRVTGQLLLKRLVSAGQLQRRGSIIALPGHTARLAPEDELLWQRVREALAPAGLCPPIVGELAKQLGLERESMLSFLHLLQQWDYVINVAPNRFYLTESLDDLAAVAQALCRESPDGSFSAGDYRDRAAIGRNLTIKVLETLDRAGITRYYRQRRVMHNAYRHPASDELA